MMDLDAAKDVPLERLLSSGDLAAAQIARGHSAPRRLRRLWSHGDNQPGLDGDRVSIPPIRVFALADVELRSDYMPYRDGVPVCSEAIFPTYVKQWFERGFRKAADVREVRNVGIPAFCVSHFNMRTYGHFLLEVLPKVLLARLLQRAGLRIPVAFPSDAGAASTIVGMLCGEDGFLPYESGHECLRVSAAICPSMMTSSGRMHDLCVAATRMLAVELAQAPSAPPVPGPKLFLSRSKWKGYRTLNNETELYQVAAEYGFDLVHPQDLTWSDQVRMFHFAAQVMGAYNSALHGTIFSQAGTKIVSFGRVNGIQEAIGDSLGHDLGFLSPSKGEITVYDPTLPKPQFYEVSARELRDRLELIEKA